MVKCVCVTKRVQSYCCHANRTCSPLVEMLVTTHTIHIARGKLYFLQTFLQMTAWLSKILCCTWILYEMQQMKVQYNAIQV